MYTVLGIFDTTKRAEDCINILETKGYNPKDISIVMHNKAQGQEIEQDTGANVTGSAPTDALVGGLAGLASAFILSGFGAFIVGGPIATAIGLTGAAALTVGGVVTGAAVGGLSSILTRFGLSESEAGEYEQYINDGGILVAVPTMDDQSVTVCKIFEAYDAVNVRCLLMPQDRMQQRNTRVISDREEAHKEPIQERSSKKAYAIVGTKGGKTRRGNTRKQAREAD